MPSERIQKRIDHLLDQADAAAEANDWQSVRTHARAVLIADPDTPDAKTLLAMADELAPEESYGTAANVPQTQAEEEKYPEPVKHFSSGAALSRPTSEAMEPIQSHPNTSCAIKPFGIALERIVKVH
jgi:hypothetical protein